MRSVLLVLAVALATLSLQPPRPAPPGLAGLVDLPPHRTVARAGGTPLPPHTCFGGCSGQLSSPRQCR
jgi:hypothetical protein